jgi:hypothetical protein
VLAEMTFALSNSAKRTSIRICSGNGFNRGVRLVNQIKGQERDPVGFHAASRGRQFEKGEMLKRFDQGDVRWRASAKEAIVRFGLWSIDRRPPNEGHPARVSSGPARPR